MKTVKVVAAVITASNENGKKLYLQHSVDMVNSKMGGNFRAEK